MMISRTILQAQGRPAVYTAPGGSPVPVRARVTDADARLRLNRTTAMVASQAIGVMSTSDGPIRGGIIEQDGSAYRIDGLLSSSVSGLVDLTLIRISGSGRDNCLAGVNILRRDVVEIDGRTVRAHVNRSGVMLEENGWGNALEVARRFFSVAIDDAVGVSAGSVAIFEGERLIVLEVVRDGLKSVRLVC